MQTQGQSHGMDDLFDRMEIGYDEFDDVVIEDEGPEIAQSTGSGEGSLREEI